MYFFIQYSENQTKPNNQSMIHLNMFMSMTGFEYNDYLMLYEAYGKDCDGEIKRKYLCGWSSLYEEGLRATFK